MIIGIDARMLGKGYGLGRYVEQLIEHIVLKQSEHTFVLFLRKDEFEKRKTGEEKKYSIRYVLADIPWYSWQEQLILPIILKREKIDLLHFPHWNVPLLYHKPFVLTMHDLTMFHFPRPEATTLGPIKYWVKDITHRVVLKNACKRARKIVTTSEFTKLDVHRTVGVPLEKMETVYQTSFSGTYPQDIPLPEHGAGRSLWHGKEQDILDDHGITKSYAMYVGAAYPHKNVERLIDAWKLVDEKTDQQFQLVLVGRENSFWKRQQSAINNQESVTYLGYITDQDLKVLYTAASLFVFPSLYEGFGLPPLEAIVHGAPVVSSNATCLPEVLGEAALYFDPTNKEDMAQIISIALEDEDIRFVLRQNAKHELGKFSSERFAAQILRIFSDILK